MLGTAPASLPSLGGLLLASLLLGPIPGGPFAASAQESGTDGSRAAIEMPRLDGAGVELDGRMDEEAWASALRVVLTHQLSPDEGQPATEQTEVRLFYDGDALYLAARAHERDPSRITERTLERNSFHSSEQDGIALILDTNGDERTAFGFIVTPSGARTDVAVFDQARVSWNTDWNAFWDATTTTDSGGWTAEVRIPFSSLRFEPDEDGAVRMGMILWRYLARTDEFIVFPEFPNRWGNSAYKPEVGTPVEFRGVQARNPIYLKPYVLTGSERRHRFDDARGSWEPDRDLAFDLGADLKYNLTNNLVLDVTANTDFAQVEADDERFNLERFSLFFPEKRDFFQERSDIFTFRIPGGMERLFHSRRIGIAEGRPVPILGGARLTGRHGDWELGLLGMQTGDTRLSGSEVPGENFGVIRVQRPVRERGSYVGALLTSRSDLDHVHNFVYALDADLHLVGDHFVGLQAAGSTDRGLGRRSGGMGTIVVQRRISRGYSFGSSYGYLGRDFRPAAGFVRRTGIHRAGHRNQYTWFPSLESRVQNHSITHRTEFVWDDGFELLETAGSSVGWRVGWRNGASANAQVEYTREVLDDGFQVGGLPVPPGTYGFMDGSLRYGSPSGSDVRLGVGVNGGEYYGGHRLGASLDLSWSPGPRISLGAQNVVNRIELPSGRRDVLISRLRLGTALSRQLTASAFIQYNSSVRLVIPNLRIRYNPREGSDLYLVYNEGIRTSLDPTDPLQPELPRSELRSVQLKYTYTFVR